MAFFSDKLFLADRRTQNREKSKRLRRLGGSSREKNRSDGALFSGMTTSRWDPSTVMGWNGRAPVWAGVIACRLVILLHLLLTCSP
jgi:hypothetical protein